MYVVCIIQFKFDQAYKSIICWLSCNLLLLAHCKLLLLSVINPLLVSSASLSVLVVVVDLVPHLDTWAVPFKFTIGVLYKCAYSIFAQPILLHRCIVFTLVRNIISPRKVIIIKTIFSLHVWAKECKQET